MSHPVHIAINKDGLGVDVVTLKSGADIQVNVGRRFEQTKVLDIRVDYSDGVFVLYVDGKLLKRVYT